MGRVGAVEPVLRGSREDEEAITKDDQNTRNSGASKRPFMIANRVVVREALGTQRGGFGPPGPFQSPALNAGRGRKAFIPEGREPCRRGVADSGVVSSHRSPKFPTWERPWFGPHTSPRRRQGHAETPDHAPCASPPKDSGSPKSRTPPDPADRSGRPSPETANPPPSVVKRPPSKRAVTRRRPWNPNSSCDGVRSVIRGLSTLDRPNLLASGLSRRKGPGFKPPGQVCIRANLQRATEHGLRVPLHPDAGRRGLCPELPGRTRGNHRRPGRSPCSSPRTPWSWL